MSVSVHRSAEYWYNTAQSTQIFKAEYGIDLVLIWILKVLIPGQLEMGNYFTEKLKVQINWRPQGAPRFNIPDLKQILQNPPPPPPPNKIEKVI